MTKQEFDLLNTNRIKVEIKKLHPEAVIPAYAKPGDAGMDLTAVEAENPVINANGMIRTYKTGLAIAIPKGYVGLLFPRSSVYKTGLRLCNSVGVIDSGYRGEIMFKFDVTSVHAEPYKVGDRIGQIMIVPYPQVLFEEVEELDETDRGIGGFGSTNVENTKQESQSNGTLRGDNQATQERESQSKKEE